MKKKKEDIDITIITKDNKKNNCVIKTDLLDNILHYTVLGFEKGICIGFLFGLAKGTIHLILKEMIRK